MKIYLYLLLCLCSYLGNFKAIYAQTIVREGRQWHQVQENTKGDRTYQFAKFEGHAMVNDTSYFVLKTNSNLSSLYWQADALFRQEGAKVFKRRGKLREYLLYDFSLEEGDQITLYQHDVNGSFQNTFLVKTVDSLALENGSKRKQITLQHETMPYCTLRWVEGIGSLHSITEEARYACQKDYLSYLVCFYKYSMLQYNHNGITCEPPIVAEIEQFFDNGIVVDFDKDQFNLHDPNSSMRSYRLLDSSGKEWSFGSTIPPTTIIEVPHLPKGTYRLLMTDWNGMEYEMSVRRY